MSRSESPIREFEDEDNIILTEESTATAHIAKEEHSSGELEELSRTENGEELTSVRSQLLGKRFMHQNHSLPGHLLHNH